MYGNEYYVYIILFTRIVYMRSMSPVRVTVLLKYTVFFYFVSLALCTKGYEPYSFLNDHYTCLPSMWFRATLIFWRVTYVTTHGHALMIFIVIYIPYVQFLFFQEFNLNWVNIQKQFLKINDWMIFTVSSRSWEK